MTSWYWSRSTPQPASAEYARAYVPVRVQGAAPDGSLDIFKQILLPAASGVTYDAVTAALGFTPYDAANPSGYVTTTGVRSAVSATSGGGLSYDSASGAFRLANTAALTFLANSSNGSATPTAVSVTSARQMLVLDQVENKSSATIRNEITTANLTNALAGSYLPLNGAGLTLGSINVAIYAAAGQVVRTYDVNDYDLYDQASNSRIETTGGATTLVNSPSAFNVVGRPIQQGGVSIVTWITPEMFGAIGDNIHDDTAALQAWLNALDATTFGRLNAKIYKFTSALTKSPTQRIAIEGVGQTSLLLYAGTSTTIDLLTLGNQTSETNGARLSGFKFDSSTTMTGGAALKANILTRSRIDDVTFGGQDGNNALYDGLFLKGFDYVTVHGHDNKVRNTGIKAASQDGSTYAAGAGLYIIGGGKIGGCGRNGIHLGGGCGGVIIDDVDVIASGQIVAGAGVLIDNALQAVENREIFGGKGLTIDSTIGYGMLVNDALMGNGRILLSGSWVASSTVHNIRIQQMGASGSTPVFSHSGGDNFNSHGDGLVDESTQGVVVSSGTTYRNNVGTAIRRSGSGPTVSRSDIFIGNGATTAGSVDTQGSFIL